MRYRYGKITRNEDGRRESAKLKGTILIRLVKFRQNYKYTMVIMWKLHYVNISYKFDK